MTFWNRIISEPLPSFEAGAAFTVRNCLREDIDIVSPLMDIQAHLSLGVASGEMVNSCHTGSYHLLPLDFGLRNLSLSLPFHGKSDDEPPVPVPTCGVGIPPAAACSVTARRLCLDSSTCSLSSKSSLTNSSRVNAPLSYWSRRF